MKKELIRFAAFISILVALFMTIRLTGISAYVEAEKLGEWIAGFGAWGPLLYILVYSIAPVLMLPGLPITVAGGLLFGPVWGLVYVMIGSTAGASLAFLVARAMGRKWVERIMGKKGLSNPERGMLAQLDQGVQTQGWKIVAITRLIPLFPYNLLNYAFGLTAIRFSHYVMATFIFMLPWATAYVVFSSSLLDLLKGRLSSGLLIGAGLMILLLLITMLYKKRETV